jgi:hypothetical protein
VPLKQNNPAARLHRILSSVSAQAQNTRLLEAFRGILAPTIPINDNNSGFFRRHGQFLALPKRARDALLDVPDLNKELYSRWIPKLEAALAFNSLNAVVSTFSSSFDKSALENLEVCAAILPSTYWRDRESHEYPSCPGDLPHGWFDSCCVLTFLGLLLGLE